MEKYRNVTEEIKIIAGNSVTEAMVSLKFEDGILKTLGFRILETRKYSICLMMELKVEDWFENRTTASLMNKILDWLEKLLRRLELRDFEKTTTIEEEEYY